MTDGTRFTLRQLPFPAKLVLTAFLTAVGLGYTAAMAQLHMKQSGRDGEALPTVANVVERFSGLREKSADDPDPCSRIDELVSGDPKAPDVGKANMAPAFFAKSKGWAAAQGARARAANLEEEREGERQAMLAWVRSDPAGKKAAYEANRFPLPDALKGRPLTAEFRDGDGLKVRDLIDQRCQTCHRDQAPSLGSWAELEPHVTPPPREVIDGKWVRSPKQISVEALTQSTHAHLLSFAMLFTLTGLVFSFTSYPAIIRGIVGPVVLIAQVFDIACWWLARLDGYGPYFATAIVMTGGVVGTGLMLQIVLGLFDLYDRRGKLVLVGLFLFGAVGFGVLGKTVIVPELGREREAAKANAAKKSDGPKPGNGSEPKVNGPLAEKKPSRLERLVMGDRTGKWNGDPDKGSMVKAFYEKDEDNYKDDVKDRGKDVVDAERDGERLAVRAWINLPDPDRKRAYDDDRLPLPADRVGKPITARYQADDRTAKVRSILADRCARCHSPGGDKDDVLLHTYAGLMKYIDETPADGRATIPMAGE